MTLGCTDILILKSEFAAMTQFFVEILQLLTRLYVGEPGWNYIANVNLQQNTNIQFIFLDKCLRLKFRLILYRGATKTHRRL